MDAFREYFLDVIKNHYADFTGRARRREYWMYTLFATVLLGALYVAMLVFGSASDVLAGLFGLLYVAVGLGLFLPNLAVAVRRLHDTGRSGWWYLIALVPIVGIFVLLYFLVAEGDAGPNEYGPDPKDPYADAQEIGDLYDPING